MKKKMKTIWIGFSLLLFGGVAFGQGPQTTEMREVTPVHTVVPQVPYPFSRGEIPGRVEVLFRVDEKGKPKDVKVEYTTHPEYAESVINALRFWRFDPAQAANRQCRLPVVFN